MDRNNNSQKTVALQMQVALRKESVDRNNETWGIEKGIVMSLSARRVWIEITRLSRPMTTAAVALRKESVDRNNR